jgi:hypothetical protein
MRLPSKQAGPSRGDCCWFLESRSSVTSPTLRCGEGTLCIDEVMQLAALFTCIHSHYLIIAVFLFFLDASVRSYLVAASSLPTGCLARLLQHALKDLLLMSPH